MMKKTLILDIQKLKKFNDEKRNVESIWTDDQAKINLICMKPGQEMSTHTHHGSHIWIVLEGAGKFMSSDTDAQSIGAGKIVIVPALVEHGIRNASNENLVLASISTSRD